MSVASSYTVDVEAVDDTGRLWQVLDGGTVTAKVGAPTAVTLPVVADPQVPYPRRGVRLTVRTSDGVEIPFGWFRVTGMEISLGQANLTLGGPGVTIQDQPYATDRTFVGDVRTDMQNLVERRLPGFPVTFAPGLRTSVFTQDYAIRDVWDALLDMAEMLGGVFTERSDEFRVVTMVPGAPVDAPILHYTAEWDRTDLFNAVTAVGSGPLGEVWIAYAEDAASVAAYGLRVADPLPVQVQTADEVQARAAEWVARNKGWGVKRTAEVAPNVRLFPGDTLNVGGLACVEQVVTPLGVGPQKATLANTVEGP
jgi:hypothetical protein